MQVRHGLVFAAVLIVLLGLWLWWAVGLPCFPISFPTTTDGSLASRGQWGDSFGALNALFSAFGFSAIIVTLYFQYNQIRHEQNEAEAARKDLLNAATERNKEQFEASYFELMKLFRDIRDEVRFKPTPEYVVDYNNTRDPGKKAIKGTTRRGLRAFRASWNEVYFNRQRYNVASRTEFSARLAGVYDAEIHKRYESTFGPYFRLVYTILHRIKNEKHITEEEKIRYANLFRCQVSSFELTLIAINGLSEFSKNPSDLDLYELLIHFHFLKYAPVGSRRETLEKCYPPKAFAPRPDEPSE